MTHSAEPDETLVARLRFVRAERARERRMTHGLPERHHANLSKLCAALAEDLEQRGCAHVTDTLDGGPTRDLAFALVSLAASGLAYAGIACTFDDVLSVIARELARCEDDHEPWRARTSVRPDVGAAMNAAFRTMHHGATTAFVPAWIPHDVAREAAAALHRRSTS